jgi:hypothetical protein
MDMWFASDFCGLVAVSLFFSRKRIDEEAVAAVECVDERPCFLDW